MKILIDERIVQSAKSITKLLGEITPQPLSLVFLSKIHPGISDADILERLLPLYQQILTTDKILHNRALALGFSSFFINEDGQLTDKPLSYAKGKKQAILTKKNPPVQEKENSILNFKVLETFSKKRKDSFELKRHHIKSSQVQTINLTVSSEELSQAIVGGYFLKVDTQPNALEGFCLDERSSHILSPLLFSLMYLYALHLSHLPLILHITSPKLLILAENLMTAEKQNDPIANSVQLLLTALPKVSILPCSKGFFFEKMHSKMHQIKIQGINEIVPLNFKIIANHLLDSLE